MTTAETAGAIDRDRLTRAFRDVREFTGRLCRPLRTEDFVVQSMPDASPTRWHLAHTTWFFETFVVRAARPDQPVVDPAYHHLFNSYYETIGDPFPRPKRGLLTRPTVEEVFEYRRVVDERVREILATDGEDVVARVAPALEVGLHHERQHQELLLTDIWHAFGQNPLHPVYRDVALDDPGETRPLRWTTYDEGVVHVGHSAGSFGYDNERPRHRVFLETYELADRPVTIGEFQEFVDDGGYRRADLWLAEGFDLARREGWRAPLYWKEGYGVTRCFTLAGLIEPNPAAPVSNVSYFEADAYARWAGARLPTEFEWEAAAAALPVAGNFVEGEAFRPLPDPAGAEAPEGRDAPALPRQMFGDVWEWTSSAYAPYPGFTAPAGALGEYNGKFMVNQYVLRGGSCLTSRSHVRATYRNFFSAASRWQCSGFRLAR
ncbi:MAG: ergothioneine biosynthesis protein EgtB [Planctomycetota bacterium JB042]